MLRWLMGLSLSLLPFAAPYAAPEIRPVPGSGAAYLYFPGEAAGRVKLKIVKEFAHVVQDRYEVYFKSKNGREELICGADEQTCEKLVASGSGMLSINGFYDPGRKLRISMAKFTGSCSTTGTRCTINMKTGSTETVRITTGCNASEYSVISLEEKERERPSAKNTVLCVGPSLDGQSYLLAAHQHIRSNLRPKTEDKKLGYRSAQDGKENTKIMMDHWDKNKYPERESAAHYCQGLNVGGGGNRMSGWYLPAEQELALVLAGWDSANQSFAIPKDSNGYWSSTEGGRNSETVSFRWSSNSKNQSNRSFNDPASAVCVYSVPLM